MLSFTPALCQLTTIALPTSLSASQDSQLLRFKASFSSRAEYEFAKRDGVRVEMWTNLDTVGGPSGGAWHALAFDYAEQSNAIVEREVEPATNAISFLSNVAEYEGHGEPEIAVFLDVHVPGDLFSYLEQPRFSFTYRLVYQSGHIEWLGAFGYDGVLAFERKDPRVTFNQDVHILTTGGGYIVESELNHAMGIGKLSSDLVWERWSFAGNGPAFSRSHITSPSGCIILTPFPAPGIHSFTPEAMQPMILTAGLDGSSLSISESGDITFYPGAEKPYTPAGLTAVGTKILALGRDTNLLDYDTTSDTMVVSSAPAPDEHQMSPIALSFVTLGPRPQGTSHVDVKLDSQKLGSVFPGSDIVLYQNVPARKLKVISTSDRENDYVTIRVKASGDKIFVAPLHDLSALTQSSDPAEVVRPVDVWQVAVISPHKSAHLVNEVHDVASVFPTPPPSPPLRMYSLSGNLDTVPSIDSVLSTVIEEDHADDATDVDETMSESASTVFSPSVSADASKDLKALLLSPSPSGMPNVPRHTTSRTFEASSTRHKHKEAIMTSPAPALDALLQMNVVSLIHTFFGRVFGILTFILAMFGLDLRENSRFRENVKVYDKSEDEGVKEGAIQLAAFTAASVPVVRVKSGVAAASDNEPNVVDLDDDKTPTSSPLSSPPTLPMLAQVSEPISKPKSRSSCLTVGLTSESSTVALILCPPSNSDPSINDRIQISVDGKTSSELSWSAVGESTFVTELHGDGSHRSELKISLNSQ